LSAAAHPCAGGRHLMPAGNDYERRTWGQLRHPQTRLGAKRAAAPAIEKPVLNPGASGANDGWWEDGNPCIPVAHSRSRRRLDWTGGDRDR